MQCYQYAIMKMFLRVVAAAMSLAAAKFAQATSVTFSASSGSLSSSVQFENIGGNLVVTLSNTSTADSLVPANILTGVFFDIAGGPLTLSRISAIVPPGSSIINGSFGSDVSGEWAYTGGLVGSPYGADYGISASGLGLFGPGDRFNTTQNLQGPASVGGLDFGITSANDNIATGNTPLKTYALIKNSVVFTLGGFGTLDPSQVFKNVSFQYGTSLSETNIPYIPPPGVPDAASTLVLAGIGMFAVLIYQRQRAKTS